MLCGFLNFEKLIGVTLSVHVTIVRCEGRGAVLSINPSQLIAVTICEIRART